MKHKMMIRPLAFILAGVMLAGNSLQVFAEEADTGISEEVVQSSLLLDNDVAKEDGETGIFQNNELQPEEDMLGDRKDQTEKTADGEHDPEGKAPESGQSPDGETTDGEQDNTPDNGMNSGETANEKQEPEKTQDNVQNSGEIILPEEKKESEDDVDKDYILEPEVPDEQRNEEQKIPVLTAPAITLVSLDLTTLSLPLQGTPGILKATAFDEAGKEIENGVTFTWSTDNGQVITIDGDGSTAVITAKSTGKASVEVRAGGKSAICDVEVIIPINSVNLDRTSLSMKKKEVTQLTATVLPADATVDTTFKWSSSNEEVAHVDDKGQVTAVASGTANITVETSDGHMAVCQITVLDEEWRTGWQQINNNWYYYNDKSILQTGWQNIEGKYYYFNESGVMQKDWLYSDGNWYYLNTGGDRRSGWLELNKKWYYLDANGVMQTGLARADGHVFYFNGSGEMQTGWQKVSNKWYFIDYTSGAQIGWKKISNKWYYFNINGEMQTDWQKVDNVWYYMNGSGEMQTGWQKIGGKWYYLLGNGAMQTGWQKINSKWYYLSGSGAMQTNWQSINNVWYYMNGSGVMQTGWQKINSKWYYLGSNGAMRTDWQKVNNKWYYFNSNGVMQTGWQRVNSNWYYMNGNGEMLVGWIKINNKQYYLGTNGAMQTGWQPVGGKWYYLNSDGSMRTGWLKSGDNWYYLEKNGSMATSNMMIDGKNNSFDSNGIWKGVVETKIRGYGIDVSSYQKNIDWKKVQKEDIDFAMLRVVSGKGSGMARDTKFKENYDGARDVGIKVGVYKYCYATSRTQARKEAEAVIQALNGRKLDCPVVLDVEDKDGIMSDSISNARRTEIILAFKKEIENAGYKFALYANLNHLNTKFEDDLLEDVDIWIARYRDLEKGHGYSGKGNIIMWQYSDKGSVRGISGDVDLNVSYKKY